MDKNDPMARIPTASFRPHFHTGMSLDEFGTALGLMIEALDFTFHVPDIPEKTRYIKALRANPNFSEVE